MIVTDNRKIIDAQTYQDKTHIMGILNVTPDSFSDGGRYNRLDAAVDHAAQMLQDGADIIDIGGESTRPGSDPVSLEEELERVIPIVEAISGRFDCTISIDTYKSETAQQALEAGAHIINDVWGAKADKKIAEVAAKNNVPIILMHNRTEAKYDDLMEELLTDLQESISIAQGAGVATEQIILDPGIGFGKTYQHNLDVMNQLERLQHFGLPVLLGTSRKSFIGKTLDVEADQRVEGTIATVCLGITKGCQIVRVHDVKEVRRAAAMMDAMLGKRGAS